MQFGPIPVAEAQGCILAHSVALHPGRLRKGTVLGAADLETLSAQGLTEVIVARLEAEDVAEDVAAQRLARALVPEPEAACLNVTQAFTGRVNLVAAQPGVVQMDVEALHRLNMCDPMITCATVLPWTRMTPGGLVATIKIISYGVPEHALAQAEAAARAAISLRPVQLRTAELFLTDTGAGPDDTKGIAATKARLTALGMELTRTETVAHRTDALAGALARSTSDLVLILTASATSDPHDVAPEAVRRAGGRVDRFGMPVDPGNLLFVGELNGRPVIGLPGCARAPALNGADWVLERVACGVSVSDVDISRMGVGGLLKEIPQRPHPRRTRP